MVEAADNENTQGLGVGGGDKADQNLNQPDQDRFLPIANINRIMKSALPSDTKISKEARECVQECVSEFIAFITCESCEITAAQKRKTINGEDIIQAMRELHFEQYMDLVENYNRKYKEALKDQEQ